MLDGYVDIRFAWNGWSFRLWDFSSWYDTEFISDLLLRL